MIKLDHFINELSSNLEVFRQLLTSSLATDYHWKPDKSKWNLIEIVCHLIDEEQEDFRYRIHHLLEKPNLPMPSISPEAWVKDRQYNQQDFEAKRNEFLDARSQSIEWLKTLDGRNPRFNNSMEHHHFGSMSPLFFLENWIAHDILHIKQIQRLKYDHFRSIYTHSIDYAGKWT